MTFFVFSVLPAPDSPLGGRGREGEWEEEREGGGREGERERKREGERERKREGIR